MRLPCTSPFESGGQLCHNCRRVPPVAGLRACSRFVAASQSMRALLDRVPVVAATDAAVVISGETGTGKEVLARAVQANGPRAEKPFLAVNVAALPSELLESELFGHVRGAFTGATTSTRGLFAAADGGTLFLDEIAEMPLPLQAKLLRVLQDGEVRRVGESASTRVDVRILCATHQDLRRNVAERRFREDLYYRLKVFTLVVPPLRERRDDILPLVELFLTQEGHKTCSITEPAKKALLSYAWPGNVRELQNAARHGGVLSRGAPVAPEHLPADVVEPSSGRPQGRLQTLAEVEREHIVGVLAACGGNQVDAARVLGIGRTTLWRKLHGYGLMKD
jgi:two-component system response regulator HydG